MAYTVKQVAEMSGVSVRTLHFYDETGLLKPASVGANGYRFYEEPQLLILQQILFYRELRFELKQVKQLLGAADFDKVAALQSHRGVLQAGVARTRTLIETIDKTIEHLKGATTMKTEDMFAGFNVAAGNDRFGEPVELGGPGGEPAHCKVSARDTGGAMAAFELGGQGAGPRHRHRDQDEWIYVLRGKFNFQVGDKRFRLGPGESVFIPRQTSHAWAPASDPWGKVINVYQPAGTMEAFFRELGKPPAWLITADELVNKTYTEDQVNAMRRMFDAHGIDLLGPPLGFE